MPHPYDAPHSPQQYGAMNEDRLTSLYELQVEPLPNNRSGLDELSVHDDDDVDEEYDMSLTELLYSSASFHAIVKPVSLTMTLAALSVVYINTEDTIRQGEAEMAAAYQVWKTDDQSDSNTGKTLVLSLANSFIMVCVICALTFAIVVLYRFRCMKCLISYMILSSATLLGILGGTLWYTAIQIYRLPVDHFSFYFGVYNFCLVGVLAIFWSKGIPTYITHGYLVATSVILAWQLAHFDSWTAWTLLLMLALYDLCAVLTPCGPLRALVNLMSKDDSPDMPGLLYEAELPPEAQRPGGRSRSDPTSRQPQLSTPEPRRPDPVADERSAHSSEGDEEEEDSIAGVSAESVPVDGPLTEIPLAIAKVYNLSVLGVATPPPGTPQRGTPLLAEIPDNPTPRELRMDVVVRMPPQGGRIERIEGSRRKAYLERDRFGTPRRTVWVDRQGKVFAEAFEGEEDDDDDEGSGKRGNSIRLGLGDFIFYSVLVAKAAQYSFATFAACILVILAGLGGTLVLLSVYHHALPALPISIFMGVVFYLMTRLVIEPWIESVLRKPYYA